MKRTTNRMPTISAKWTRYTTDCNGEQHKVSPYISVFAITLKRTDIESAVSVFKLFHESFVCIREYCCGWELDTTEGDTHTAVYYFERTIGKTEELKRDIRGIYAVCKESLADTILRHEGTAWLALHEYEYYNAPITANVNKQVDWETHDEKRVELLYHWRELNKLCEKFGIRATGSTWHKKASELSHELFLRREAVRGIYYDWHSTKIASDEKLYRCHEDGSYITERELCIEWGNQPAEERTCVDFPSYIRNCLSKNGFLEEVEDTEEQRTYYVESEHNNIAGEYEFVRYHHIDAEGRASIVCDVWQGTEQIDHMDTLYGEDVGGDFEELCKSYLTFILDTDIGAMVRDERGEIVYI